MLIVRPESEIEWAHGNVIPNFGCKGPVARVPFQPMVGPSGPQTFVRPPVEKRTDAYDKFEILVILSIFLLSQSLSLYGERGVS